MKQKFKLFMLWAFCFLGKSLLFLPLLLILLNQIFDIYMYTADVSWLLWVIIAFNIFLQLFLLFLMFTPLHWIKVTFISITAILYIFLCFFSQEMDYISYNRKCIEAPLSKCKSMVKFLD